MPPIGQHCVYGLYDLPTEPPFYVGYTHRFKIRMASHINRTYKSPCWWSPKDWAIVSLNMQNRPVVCKVLGVFGSELDGLRFEARKIKEIGFENLTNRLNPKDMYE